MQPCEAEGRYAGYLTKMAVGTTTGGCLQLLVECALHAEYDEEDKGWRVLQGGPQEISGRIILTKRNGAVNGYPYGVLKNALDWDGKDIEDLQKHDFSQVKVGIHIEEEEYQGQSRLEVNFISALDWKPGINKARGTELAKIKAAWAATKQDAPEDDGPSPEAIAEGQGDTLPPDDSIPF